MPNHDPFDKIVDADSGDFPETTDDDFLNTLPEISPEDQIEEDPPEPEEPEAVDAPIKKKRKRNYLNNADLLEQIALSKAQDQMTDHLVKMLLLLCDRYGAKPQYSGYSFIDDMKQYAMFMLARTWRAFNAEKGSNPFAFYTQCVKNSFIQYLNREQEQRDLRDMLLINAGLNPSYNYGDGDDGDGGYNNDY